LAFEECNLLGFRWKVVELWMAQNEIETDEAALDRGDLMKSAVAIILIA
jgi:hypothetical protein